MRYIVTFLLLAFSTNSFAQTKHQAEKKPKISTDVVSFITKLDIANATKDGIYLNEYVVNLNYEQSKKLNGKTIRVIGKVTIIPGIKNLQGDNIQQGRQNDTKHIASPLIEIIKE